MKTDILLESGNNEIEIFEFIVGNQSFGINALKISELTQYKSLTITQLPQMNEAIYGTTLFRGKVVPLIDIGKFLGMASAEKEPEERQVVLFCEYNKKVYGFMIDKIVSIHRLDWTQIQPPHKSMADNVVTAFSIINGKEVSILDFETITYTLLGEEIFKELRPPYEHKEAYNPESLTIYIADDSSVIRKKVLSLLEVLGYKNIRLFENGQLLFDALLSVKKACDEKEERITSMVNLVLTDIEMPAMDGLTLTKNIKSIESALPVIVMSSMINDQIALKCQSVKANASLSKSDMLSLPGLMENILTKRS